MKYRIIPFLFFLIQIQAFSQSDSLKRLQLSGYGELYYNYDFSKPDNHEISNFLYNHKRHNELNANLILVKANYIEHNYRANLGLMAGNYAHYNLIAEPAWAQFIYEANIGVKLSKKNNVWFDAGIMPSHIGFESAISADCWTLTRSLMAENSPYYETAVKLTYQSKNEKILLSTMYLNGWQRIQKPDGIQKPSFGTQFTFKPTNEVTLNYSNFIGTDKPDSLNSFRHFHNFYLMYELPKKLGIIAGFDIGSDKYNLKDRGIWYTPVLILKHIITDNTKIAFRIEYYSDPNQIIITTGTKCGFHTLGLSTNYDYDINEKMKFRIEGKMYHSKDKIFNNNNNNFSLITNLTFKI